MRTPRPSPWLRTIARVLSGQSGAAQRDAAYQLQIYAIALLALALSALTYIPIYLFLLGEPVGAMAIGVCTVGGIATFPLYLATRSLRLALQAMSAAIFTVTSFLTWHQGGLSSAVAPWLLIVPFALSIAGMSGPANVWFGIVLVEMAAMGAMQITGHGLVPHRGTDPQLLYVVSQPGLFLVIFAFLFLVNRARHLAFVELHAQNDEFSKARDMALDAVREKSRFLANMSHEIRTPLNGILGTADVLADTPLSTEQQRFVDLLKQSGGSLLALVNDVLDFSKIEAGKVTLEYGEFHLRDLIEGVAELFAPTAAEKGLRYSCRVAASLPPIVRGDPLRLRQVLSNLLNNAIKFTSSGEVAIEAIPASDRPGHADGVHFRIIDSGIGIDDAVRERLFKAFSQADDTTTRVFGGTGLGLVISGELVRLMGGRIEIDSSAGRGSCFHFVLPGAIGPASADDTIGRARPDLPEARVAVVKRDSRARLIVIELLADMGLVPVVYHSVADLVDGVRERTCPARWIIGSEMLSDPGWAALAQTIPDGAAQPWRVIATAPYGQSPTAPDGLRIDAVVAHPLRRSALLDALVEPAAAGHAPDAGHGPHATLETRVLLVEDNRVNQQIAMAMLKRMGCAVDLATDGASGVLRWREGAYDIVLMDCQMPVLDGYDAARAIRTFELQLGRPRTPVIALTANALAGDRELCLDAGMDDHLGKPFTLDLLRATIEKWAPSRPTAKAA